MTTMKQNNDIDAGDVQLSDGSSGHDVNMNPLVCGTFVPTSEIEPVHMHAVVTQYWQPSSTVRSLVNTALFLGAWASGYTAAQIYYTALTVKLGYGYFVTVGNNGLGSVVGPGAQFHVFLVGMSLNVVFGLGAWALVHIQLAAGRHATLAKHTGRHEGSSVAEGISVFITKWVDSVSDGVTFFSTIILFSVLETSFGGGGSPQGRAVLLPELLLFAVTLTMCCVAWVVCFERIPHWYYCWYMGLTEPPAGALTTNRLVDDWFIGQWQWLMGFAWWSTGLVLLTNDYLGMYNQAWAWWALAVCALLGYVAFALGHCDCGCDCGCGCCPKLQMCAARGYCAEVFREQPRLGAMLAKSVSWVFGIGCYFSMKRTSATFMNALNLQRVDREVLATFSLSVTAVSFSLLLALELAERRVERLTGEVGGASSRLLPSPADVPFVGAVRANRAMLRLSLCYVTGKAWEALAFGFQDTMAVEADLFANIAVEWQLIAGAFALVHTMWVLKTQRRHGDAHSAQCVCTVCAPEYYRVADGDTSTSACSPTNRTDPMNSDDEIYGKALSATV